MKFLKKSTAKSYQKGWERALQNFEVLKNNKTLHYASYLVSHKK